VIAKNDVDSARLPALRSAALNSTYVSLGGRRTVSVHEFYRYPARFSPQFAGAAVQAFTDLGDLVIDPFVGGGTSLVESQRLGRPSIGADINPLAAFVSSAKTDLYMESSLDQLREVAVKILDLPLVVGERLDNEWAADGYWRNISGGETWRIRNLLLNAMSLLEDLDDGASRLARCALLRTGQWALDMRESVPTAQEFRRQLRRDIESMVDVASAHREEVLRTWGSPHVPLVLEEGLPEVARHPDVAAAGSPGLVLTSPPYPGVYVNYHRWKVRGRKETPAPYWIANRLDGHGISRYTMSARNRDESRLYFQKLRAAFEGVVALMSRDTWLVQVVGFNGGPEQFDRYLSVMEDVGLREVLFRELATDPDGRLWRRVPGRRWWVKAGELAGTAPSTSREVVLVHRWRGT
jgi:hypothetical protein